jgi:hypothetical protein
MNTPETEALQDELLHADTYVCWLRTLNLARKLERERDEARKVADELANATRAEFGELNWRLDSYRQLPHVKAK